MAKSTGGTLLTVGLVGVAGYLAYEYFFTAPATAAPAPAPSTLPPQPTTTSAPASMPAEATTTTQASAVPVSSTLDQIYQQIKAGIKTDPNFAGSGDSATGTTDQFNYYLNLYRGAYNLPDVLGSVFPTSQTLTLAQFWAAMAPALKAAVPGLSGLGFYGGLGAIVYARRGRF